MAFEAVATPAQESDVKAEIIFVQNKELTKGQVVCTGTYISTKVVGQFDSECMFIKESEEKIYAVRVSGNLKYFNKMMEKGDFVRITYLGMEEIKQGKWAGKMSHTFKVEKDSDKKALEGATESINDEDIPF